MPELDAYLNQLDHAWSHDYESVASALHGVTEEEAFWQAPCYAAEERAEGWPAPGTIAWQVAHLIDCKQLYAVYSRGAGEEEPPPPTPPGTLAALRAALDEAHAQQRAAMAAIGDDRLDQKAGNGMPFREFLAMCIRHDSWHASQIAVARRLYRTGC